MASVLTELPAVVCSKEASKISSVLPPGVAAIKPEFLAQTKPTSVPEKDAGEISSSAKAVESKSDDMQPPPAKRARRRGQNKHRPRPAFIPFSEMLCPSCYHGDGGTNKTCHFGDKCRYTHDIAKYISNKPPDIGNECYLFKIYGKCPYGRACRFAGSHLTADFENIVDESLYDPNRPDRTLNVIPRSLQEKLRKRQLSFVRSEAYLKRLKETKKETSESAGVEKSNSSCGVKLGEQELRTKEGDVDSGGIPAGDDVDSRGMREEGEQDACGTTGSSSDGRQQMESGEKNSLPECSSGGVCVQTCGPLTDEDTVKLKSAEKRTVNFKGKLYLAPLTTVGNLPFRRICKELGADITCGEMAMCTNLLQGQQSEWALLKRHCSEDLFGVQVCGSHADTMTKCAELINTHATVDFVDINTGCPIDLVFKKGAGSALMGRHTRFEGIVRGMVEVLDCPLTVKMRTGIYNKNWNAHKLVSKLRDWGVSLMTVHGRSREQRYTKVADWEYIKTCAAAAQPVPLFGNGDMLSFEDYNHQLSTSGVDGIMIARGALIKPWIFKEIKEQRHWDISSSERLDILRRYVNYGLEHWGSDSQGVENTRRFLLEWLSFLYRYIPVGVLEQVPQRINHRPPAYVGRDDLETLMASNNCKDWIKISEMLLGPVPGNFDFLPKHKANAYT